MAADPAGNIKMQNIIVFLDRAAPDLTVFTPRDGLWTNQSRVLITGATEEGAFVTINGQNINVQNTVFSSYVSLLEGPNRIELTAKDPAGNKRAVIRNVCLDTRPPELSVTSPADHIWTSSNVVLVTGSVDFGAEVRINGERMLVTDFVFSTSLRYVSDGTQVIEVTARDMAGNDASVTRTVVIDTIQPFINITFPLDNSNVRHRMVSVSGQTEPGATIVVNTETVIKVGNDGLFSVPVVMEDGLAKRSDYRRFKVRQDDRIRTDTHSASANRGIGIG